MYDFGIGGSILFMYQVVGIMLLVYLLILARIFANTIKEARLRAQRPRSDEDSTAVMFAFLFPIVMLMFFGFFFASGYQLLATGSVLLYSFVIAHNQSRAWGSTKGARMLATGSVVLAAVSYGALLYGDTQTGLIDLCLNIAAFVLAPMLWLALHSAALELDINRYISAHSTTHCQNCGYPLAGLAEMKCPECGSAGVKAHECQ